MANEITVLEIHDRQAQLLFLYPINAPVQVGGANVVPTPASNTDSTSALPQYADKMLSATEKNELGAGTLAFAVVSFVMAPGLTNAQLLARAREIYASNKAVFDAEYTARFSRIGQRFDAV